MKEQGILGQGEQKEITNRHRRLLEVIDIFIP